jgi:hypothetical protein
MQRFHAIARCSDHPLDLVVLAFQHGQLEFALAARMCRDGRNRLRFAMQQHAFAQRGELRVVEGMTGRRQIDLRHLAFRRRVRMDELAVVGQQQKPRRVLIEPPDALDAARRELRGQQVEDAQMMLRIARALITRRLVEHEVRTLAIRPRRAVDFERERVGRNIGVGIVDGRAADRHAAVRDQCAALTARAETL